MLKTVSWISQWIEAYWQNIAKIAFLKHVESLPMDCDTKSTVHGRKILDFAGLLNKAQWAWTTGSIHLNNSQKFALISHTEF